jgi:hypothetical protein
MRGKCLARWVAFLGFAIASTASAAPIEVVARLNPGQSGPVYAWSLYLNLEEGYEVGGVDIMTSGFDAFEINLLNPAISPLDSVYTINPLGDGRNALIVNNVANGVAFSTTPAEGVLLGTLYSSFRTSPPVALHDGEVEFGGTVYDPWLRARPPEEVSLSAYPRALISLVAVPEPGAWLLLAISAGAIAAGRRARA